MQVDKKVPRSLKEKFSELSLISVIEEITKIGSISACSTKGIKKLLRVTKWTKIMLYTLIIKWCLEHQTNQAKHSLPSYYSLVQSQQKKYYR